MAEQYINIDLPKLVELIKSEVNEVSSGPWCGGQVAIGKLLGVEVQINVTSDEDDMINEKRHHVIKVSDTPGGGIKAVHDNGWNHGFIYALAQVNRLRGDCALVEDLLRESGIAIEDFKKVEAYDLKEVKRAIKRNQPRCTITPKRARKK